MAQGAVTTPPDVPTIRDHALSGAQGQGEAGAATRIMRAGSSYLFVENCPHLLRQIMFGEGLSEQLDTYGQLTLT